MNISKEAVIFLFAIFLCIIVFMMFLLKKFIDVYNYISSSPKIIFDFYDKASATPYKLLKKENFLHITFYKNFFTDFFIRRFLIFEDKIYISDNFKRNSDLYKIKNPSFEKLILNNLEIILKNMTININSAVICSFYEDKKIYAVLKCLIPLSGKIYISTSDENFYKNINRYCLENYGLGLLKKDIVQTEDADLIIILNERKNDFYKKGRYVISLMENHPLFNCNLLWDFYEKNNEFLNDIPIKKAYFIEDSTKNLKLQWKIMKKS